MNQSQLEINHLLADRIDKLERDNEELKKSNALLLANYKEFESKYLERIGIIYDHLNKNLDRTSTIYDRLDKLETKK